MPAQMTGASIHSGNTVMMPGAASTKTRWPVARVSLSRSAIVSARALMIAITGQQKREVLEAAITQGASSNYPVGRILADVELPVDVHWAA